MKYHILKTSTLFLICLLTITCYGQSKKLMIGENKGKNFKLSVEKVTNNKESTSILIKAVANNKSVTILDYNKLKIIEGASLDDNHLIPSIVNSVLSNKLPELKKQKAYITVRVFPNHDGSLKNVEYIIDKSTNISIGELESISKKVLEQVRVKFPEKVDNNILIAPLVQNVRFK